VRQQRELVELLARQPPGVGDVLGSDALVREVAAVPGGVLLAQRTGGEGRAHRGAAHHLDATGDREVVLAGDDAGGGEVHRLLRGAALAVDRGAGDRLRPTCGKDRRARDVEGLLADLHHAAPDHVIDQHRVDAGALGEGLQDVRRDVGGVDARQASAPLAQRGSDSFDDDGIAHGDSSEVCGVVGFDATPL